FSPYVWSGMELDPTSTTVVTVGENSPAERAGVVSGDRVVHDAMTDRFLNEWNNFALREGERYEVTLEDGGRSRTALIYPAWTTAFTQDVPNALVAIDSSIAFIIAILIAAVLFTLRPGVMTGALILAILPSGFPYVTVHGARDIDVPLDAIGTIIFQAGFVPALLIVALRFPDDNIGQWRLWAQRIAIGMLVASALTVAVITLIAALHRISPQAIFGEIGIQVFAGIQAIAGLLAIGALIGRFRGADGEIRLRIRWATIGMVASLIAIIVALIVDDDMVYAVAVFGYIFFPAGAAYALLKTRFVDPRFIVSRYAVYTVMALFAGIVIFGVDWLTGHFLVEPRARRLTVGDWLSAALEGAVAVGLGLLLHRVHRYVEAAIEGAIFREKHDLETFLDELGETLRCASEEAIDTALASTLPHEMGLASAALFRRDGNGEFVRAQAVGWPDGSAARLTKDDQLILFLEDKRRPMTTQQIRWRRRDLPSGIAAPVLAIPIILPEAIIAIVIYSAHADHSELDVTERSAIARFAERAAAGYNNVRSTSMVKALADAERRCAELMTQLHDLRSLGAKAPS
ncbi:MAG TPA: hypothetical protein VK665_07725, partial [Candidatus Elarobacter sp.]|nr:hypothetical protein [Candidatus Elarobacter sp.]